MQIKADFYGEAMTNAPFEVAFLCLWLLICLVGISKAYFMAKFLAKGDTVLHEEMVGRLIKSPMLFYDTVSVGSIINRFVIDLDEGNLCFGRAQSNLIFLILFIRIRCF